MQFLLIPQGSSGDVNPFVGIGRELARRGHDVTVATCNYFQETIERAGLGFEQIGTTEHYLRIVSNPDLWHPTRGSKVIFGDPEVGEAVKKTYETVTAFHERHPDGVVAAGTLSSGARVALEMHPDLRMASIHLQPGVLRSTVDPPVLAGVAFPPWAPRFLVNGFFRLGDWVIDGLLKTSLTQLRKELQLPPQKRYLKDWIHSPQLSIGLFPRWFASAPDWPQSLKLTDFVREDGASTVPPDLQEWLDAGDPPLVFTFGSAMAHGEKLFAAACDACKLLSRRGLLLTKFPEQLPKALPPGVRHCHYAPLVEVLPQCALLVHHGGVGTTARGLQAGIPQIIVALGHDQFDNAHRVKRLGAGDSLKRAKVNGASLAESIENCLANPAMQSACRKVAEQFGTSDGAVLAADALEELGRMKTSPVAGAAYSS
jgi:rhamnosyltransferase subunit B